eukprot:TRINITY_DN1425_c4_g1_i1.p1 TRINITY_DN1425_c4_g1~~TRINITY_DN1425_c4_g1_i1.p1  ORF type:complete len:333 (+),score=44.74 TRINITY_DN1425_c4_g1_i1:46-999(+)
MESEKKEIEHEKHIKICLAAIEKTTRYEALDANRMTLLYFAVLGIATHKQKDTVLTTDLKQKIIEWIYMQQESQENGGGFRSTNTIQGNGEGHITMTQCALLTLLTCGDDLSRVNTNAIATHLKNLQTKEGGFICVPNGESDVRFMYSACVTASILKLFHVFDTVTAVKYIQNCLRYDGGFGANPGCEGHGGTTFCALASLKLLNAFDSKSLSRTKKWLVSRLSPTGFNGRPNKTPDTCYTYWIGTSLSFFPNAIPLDMSRLVSFVCDCQKNHGGIAKTPDAPFDLLHTALPIAGLVNIKAMDGTEMNAVLGLPVAC